MKVTLGRSPSPMADVVRWFFFFFCRGPPFAPQFQARRYGSALRRPAQRSEGPEPQQRRAPAHSAANSRRVIKCMHGMMALILSISPTN